MKFVWINLHLIFALNTFTTDYLLTPKTIEIWPSNM